MNLHDFIILMILLIGTSGYNEIQYKIYKWIHSEVTNPSTKSDIEYDAYTREYNEVEKLELWQSLIPVTGLEE